MLNVFSKSLLHNVRASTGQNARLFSTSFDGDMARLYLNFFDKAKPAWEKTKEITLDATGGKNISTILDVASGPGEPGLTLASTFPDANVLVTDSSDAMLELAQKRIADQGLGQRVQTKVMNLQDFSPVAGRQFDLVTAQLALMFTPDLPGSLKAIHDSLREGGFLIGTVWEEFYILPLVKDTMTAVLGKEPPPPPINPLSLRDRDVVDAALAEVNFQTIGRHNETAQLDLLLGDIEDDDTVKLCLLPVTPTLKELVAEGKEDAFSVATEAMRNAAYEHGMVNEDGQLQIKTSTYRYFVAQK